MTIPLTTRLSSTRSTPRTSVGKFGSIRHYSSLGQNKFLRMIAIPFPKTNQDRVVRGQKLMGFDHSFLAYNNSLRKAFRII
jgi:hypothetical protein